MPTNRWAFTAAALALALGVIRWDATAAAPRSVQRGDAPYAIDVWQTEDGLPQNSVIAMTQTRDGYLWLGTLNGLVRFDGLRFTVFDENNTPGLNSSPIVHLFEDREGGLWIGTETDGVALLKDGQIHNTGIGRGSREGRLAAACQDATGAVWLYTADGQLWRHRNGVTNVFLVGADRFSVELSSRTRALMVEQPGLLWVGMDRKLSALNPPTTNAPELSTAWSLPVNSLEFVLARERGGYWRLAGGRIQEWATNHLVRDWGPYPWIPGQHRVGAACEDAQGNLIVGTWGAGVFWFDGGGKATAISTNEGLSQSIVLSVLMDREGSLWVGTDGGGLNRVRRQAFAALEETHPLVVQSVAEDADGALWIGFNGGGVGRWHGGAMQRFVTAQGLVNLYTRSVLADRDQALWAGTFGGGLFRWQTNHFRLAAGPQWEVSTLFQDRAGQLWAGTQSGLARWNGREWKLFTQRDGMSSDSVRALAEDRAGNLWIGTAGGGLMRWRDGQFTAYRKPDGFPSDDVASILVDADDVLWIATMSSGLVRGQNGRWTRYTTREGLISNNLGYLLEDGLGFLWIGSNAGLMRAPKQALNDVARGVIASVPLRAYGKQDGLPTSECSRGSQPGALRARDGTLWFPTIKGLVSVHPDRLQLNTNPPPVVIEQVVIEGQPQNTNRLLTMAGSHVTIPPGRERLEIHYTSLNLAAPEQARFRYQLTGHETAWVDAGNTRVARYPKLPPGHYQFEVSACNEDGVWNRTGARLAIVVEPPFWRTWWFLTATVLALLGSVIAVVHFLSTQKLQRQVEKLRQQEALEKERARIARDIHDQLGASLTQVSLLGELVETDKDSPTEVAAHARQITQTARETQHALDEIVWTVNPSNDTLEGLINYICKHAQEYLEVAGLRYRLDVPPQLPDATITPEVRHNVFLAAKESVTNIVRHARATSAWIRLTLEPSRFTLEIEDDGCGPAGFDPKRQATRNGLRNMSKRMEDVGGRCEIGPAPERGTRVRLTAPFANR